MKHAIKGAILILILVLIITSLRLTGFSVKTTSRVIIDPGIMVLYDKFNGSTTEFISLNDYELQTIRNMALEKVNSGKIVFNEEVNLTQDVENNIVDLNSNVNISHNWIEINTTKLTSLEKSATLYLYDLNFTNPRIVRNGDVCSSSICVIQSYSQRTLIFNVTQFSNYLAEETPIELFRGPSGPGGGGGWAGRPNFNVSKDLIKVLIKQGEVQRETLEIVNTGNADLDISIEAQDIARFIAISEHSFSLKPKESKKINLDIFAKEDENPDAYIGQLIIKAKDITKIVNVIIEVTEKKPLFDIRTSVLNTTVQPNDEVKARIYIKNMGDLEHIDTLLYYAIKSFTGTLLFFKEESISIGKEISIIRGIKINELPDGKYVFYARASYNNINASSSDVFEVKRIETPKIVRTDLIKIFMVIIIGIAIIIFAVLFYKIIRKFYNINLMSNKLQNK